MMWTDKFEKFYKNFKLGSKFGKGVVQCDAVRSVQFLRIYRPRHQLHCMLGKDSILGQIYKKEICLDFKDVKF